MHSQYREQGFEILAFPSNQFASQEPGTDAEIKQFAMDRGAGYPLFAKCDVNGPQTCDVYSYLRNNSELYDAKAKTAKNIPWNFAKFLVDSEGKVVSYDEPATSPKALEDKVKKMLGV